MNLSIQGGYAQGAGFTYTPTLTNTTNITTSAALIHKVLRIGNIINIAGYVTFTPTAAALCELSISLPFATNLTASTQVAGLCSDVAGVSGIILADTSGDTLKLQYTAASTSSKTVAFTCSYQL